MEGRPVRPAWTIGAAGGLLAALVVGLLAGCTADPAPTRQAAPPPPPAACVLDGAALAATTGITWVPDQNTATDTRCVYDAAGPPPVPGSTPAFLAVDIAPTGGGRPDAELDMIAQVCEEGSRAPVTAADGGFVCRTVGGGVYSALVRGGQVLTVAAATVPPGTTGAWLVVAVSRQLGALRP